MIRAKVRGAKNLGEALRMKKKSLVFNGSSDYISFPDNKDWKFGKAKDYTICMSYNPKRKDKWWICEGCKDWSRCKYINNM